MAVQYTKDQYWKIYETLPQELKEAVFSNETAEDISTACERNKVAQETIPRVASQVGDVLMGITMPIDFQQALQKEVRLKPSVVQAIAQEINRLVFYPVKAALEEIHRAPAEKIDKAADIGIATPRHTAQEKETLPEAEDDYVVRDEEDEEQEIVKEPAPKRADEYRESIDED